MKDVTKVAIFVIVIWCIVSVAKPFWYRHGLEKQLETASIYGTKHSVGSTRKFLDKKMKQEGFDFRGEDFLIEKDEDNTVSISITYEDEISIFGVTLRELEFSVKGTSFEAREPW